MSAFVPPYKPRLGLALGSGSARGWAHIGVIQALETAGIRPDVVCGSSIGALVGAAYAAGDLERLEAWVRQLNVVNVAALMDFRLTGGMLKGERLMRAFRDTFRDRVIEDLDLPYAAVATALQTGTEVWLRRGPAMDAVRASIALPGLFSPVWRDGRLLVDGGLVNPVPVSLARAMDADIVIAVDLNTDILSRHLRHEAQAKSVPPADVPGHPAWLHRMQENLSGLLPASNPAELPMPSTVNVLATSLNIMQARITRSRMAGDPPDITLAPRLAHLALMDFHRASEAIDAGERAVTAALPLLHELLAR